MTKTQDVDINQRLSRNEPLLHVTDFDKACHISTFQTIFHPCSPSSVTYSTQLATLIPASPLTSDDGSFEFLGSRDLMFQSEIIVSPTDFTAQSLTD